MRSFFFFFSKSCMVYLWLQIVSGQEDVISMAQQASSELLKRAGIIIPKRMNVLWLFKWSCNHWTYGKSFRSCMILLFDTIIWDYHKQPHFLSLCTQAFVPYLLVCSCHLKQLNSRSYSCTVVWTDIVFSLLFYPLG